MRCHNFAPAFTRRAILRSSAGGFGHLVLSALAARSGLAAASPTPGVSPLAGRAPHFVPRARRILTDMTDTQRRLFDLFGLHRYAPTR